MDGAGMTEVRFGKGSDKGVGSFARRIMREGVVIGAGDMNVMKKGVSSPAKGAVTLSVVLPRNT
jgi:hypothetical protein